MKFQHTGMFIPSNTEPSNITDTKFFDFITESDVKPHKIPETTTKSARGDFIGEYALRKYWLLGLGESEIIQHEWKNMDDLKNIINSITYVDRIQHKNDFIREALILSVDDSNLKATRLEIEGNYPRIPIKQGYSCLEIPIRWKWLGSNKFYFDDLEHLWKND